jgi:hypothetical protein
MPPRSAAPAFDGAVGTDSHGRMDLGTSCYSPKVYESSTPALLGRAFAILIEFLGDAKLFIPGTGCRSWPVASVSQGSFARRTRIVMPDTARWDGIQPCASARGAYRCAPTLASSAHEEGPPRVLVGPRAPDVDGKIAKRTQSHRQESWRFPRLNGKETRPSRRPAGPAVRPSPRRCPSAVPFPFCGTG